jgi:hypothetical protein
VLRDAARISRIAAMCFFLRTSRPLSRGLF